MKNRKDAWSSEDDQILTETVLEYIKNGDTKTSAYKKAAETLGRTPSACRYRWNTVLKNSNESQEHSSPSKKRFDKSDSPINVIDNAPTNETTIVREEVDSEVELKQVIDFLIQLKDVAPEQGQGHKDLLEENQKLMEQNKLLTKRLQQKQIEFEKIRERYQLLIETIEEAEKLSKGNLQEGYLH